ncbi:MAG: thermonuclease family protein [Thermoleophilia bacterium]
MVVALVVLARLLAPAFSGSDSVPPTYPAQGVLEARLVRVVDGDTIIVQVKDGAEERVRYEGIDAPETVKPGSPVEPFGPEAAEANAELLSAGTLRLELDVRQRDRFGRLLAYVFAGELFVNEELVRQGYAHLSTFPPNVRYADRLQEAQRQAREKGAGLWAD